MYSPATGSNDDNGIRRMKKNYNQAMRLGADDFLTKPLDFKILKEKLKNMINGKNIGS